jgi:hypothetical protein
MANVDHGMAFSIKTLCRSATILQHGDPVTNGYRYHINSSGYLVATYAMNSVVTSVTLPLVINDNVFHKCIVHWNNATKALTVMVDTQATSSILPSALSIEPVGPLYVGGHDGDYASYNYDIPNTFVGEIDFVKINCDNIGLIATMSMLQNVSVLPGTTGIRIGSNNSPILFKSGNVPIESYGTIIMAVRMPASLSSKIIAVSGVTGLSSINIRSGSGDVISFERAGVAEYNSTHPVSANEMMVIAITSISGDNNVYISKNLSGRQAIATAGNYKLPTEVIGYVGPFDLVRIVSYSTPLSVEEERYLIKQTMQHPNVGLL